MPGPNTYVLFGEEHEFKPLKGRDARVKFPQLVAVISQFLALLKESEVDLSAFLNDDSGDIGLDKVIALVNAMAIYLGDNMDKFEREYVPMVLGLDADEVAKLETEGEPQEVYIGFIKGLMWLFKRHVTPEVQDAMNFKSNPSKNQLRAVKKTS